MKPKIGLALGSGGARGWSHIGAIKALADAGIEPDIICGTSMGALVGAAYVSGALDRLEDFARSITRFSLTKLIDINPATGGVIEGLLVSKQLRDLGYATDFSGIDRPFLAVASDLFGASEVWLQTGNLVDAIRASTAIPGIVSPVRINERWLMDGGMTNPVPVSACRALGADIVIAIDANSRLHSYRQHFPKTDLTDQWAATEGLILAAPTRLRPYLTSLLPRNSHKPKGLGYFEVLSACIDVMVEQIQRSRLAGDPPHLMVSPNLSQLSILDFHHAAEAIAEGQRAMSAQIETLSALL
ncbi:patatin-like phospholipase family protein [Sulfitobacter sp. MF3-043]|uniref:patatin-like phospholipase family protein n=1 Tax=Sulfitobacter sediminivivens TaxID=3252902 RepID=UPI0036DBC54B